MDSAQSYQQQQQYEEQMSVQQQQQQQQFQQQSYEEHQRVSFAEETCEYYCLILSCHLSFSFFCIAKLNRILISLMTFKKIFQACYFLQHQTINVRIGLH